MKFARIFAIYIILFILFCFPVKADEEGIENYLIGMTVAKSFGNNYEVYLKLRQNTDRKFKLKNLGNSSYALILPQIKTLIDANEIVYETEHKDIKIVISEKRDLTDRTKFYTKINFKTKNDALIHVEAYAPKSSKTQVILKNEIPKNDDTQLNNLPNWIWYLPVIILSLICILLMVKPEEYPEKRKKKKSVKTKEEEKQEDISDITALDEESESMQDDTSINEFFIQHNLQNEKDTVFDESDKIVDELVKVLIPENDLVLMPGVPELPGLEKNENKAQNTKIILKNVKIDLFDALDGKNATEPKIPYIPQKMSISERLKNRDMIKEADDIIFSEKEAFFDTISPIQNIPDVIRDTDTSEHDEHEEINNQNISETDENMIVNPQIQSDNETITNDNEQIYYEQDKYDKLIKSFIKPLAIAHKIQNPEEEELPEIIDTFGVSDTIGFNLVKYGQKYSFVGNIEQNVFVLKTFTPEEVKDELLYMEYCTQTPYSATYSVILNKFKALVKVSETEISLIGEYE